MHSNSTFCFSNMVKWLCFASLIFVCDQIVKYKILTVMNMHEIKHFFPGFNLVLVFNKGAAFGFLASAGGWQRWLFTIIASCLSLVFVYWLGKIDKHAKLEALSICLLLGGAIGNLTDRIRLGYVVDYIDIYVRDMHWPAFNIADIAITTGAILFALCTLFNLKRS